MVGCMVIWLCGFAQRMQTWSHPDIVNCSVLGKVHHKQYPSSRLVFFQVLILKVLPTSDRHMLHECSTLARLLLCEGGQQPYWQSVTWHGSHDGYHKVKMMIDSHTRSLSSHTCWDRCSTGFYIQLISAFYLTKIKTKRETCYFLCWTPNSVCVCFITLFLYMQSFSHTYTQLVIWFFFLYELLKDLIFGDCCVFGGGSGEHITSWHTPLRSHMSLSFLGASLIFLGASLIFLRCLSDLS